MLWAVTATDKGMRVGADRWGRLLSKETYGAWHWLSVVTIYVLATLLTDAHFMGDTADYVDSIVAYESGRDYWFWEFGHVLWRPLGWAVMVICRPLTSIIIGADVRANALVVVLAINWIAGLVSVLALYGVLNQMITRWWIVILTTSALIFSHGFLNYSQTGCSYIPGLAFLLVSLYLLVRHGRGDDGRFIWGLLAGLSLAGALYMWIPLLLGIPAILLAPVLLTGSNKRTWKLVLTAAVTGGLLTALVYLAVMIWGVGVTDIAGVRAWMAKTAGGPAQDKSLQRMVFGFARSFIYMGNDGMLFKRYLVGDPFNPVTPFDLLRLSLWKIGLFYLFIASLALSLLRTAQSRRVLCLLLINALPIMGLAALWQGGDIERYLALYPVLFLSLAVSLAFDKPGMLLRYITLVFVAAMVLTNSMAMARMVLNSKQETTAFRARQLQQLLKPASRVFAVTFQDDFVNFNRSFPFHPDNRVSYNPYAIVAVGTTQAPLWRQDFAAKTEETWSQGGDVWVSKRVLSSRPLPEWNWVEGDDKSVSWPDINTFFSRLEFGHSVGGEDGFALLPPSENNRAMLAAESDSKSQ